jgi:hypothetical protein
MVIAKPLNEIITDSAIQLIILNESYNYRFKFMDVR